MHRKPVRRSSLFLLELIIAILFFSLAATICVRFFVKSHTLEAESKDLNHAVTSAVSVAEILRNQKEPYACLQSHFPLGEPNGASFQIYYDKNWQFCSAADAEYTTSLETVCEDSILTGTISVSKGDTSIYDLTIEAFQTGKGDEG